MPFEKNNYCFILSLSLILLFRQKVGTRIIIEMMREHRTVYTCLYSGGRYIEERERALYQERKPFGDFSMTQQQTCEI